MTDISALEAYAGTLSEAAQRAEAASEKQHQYINSGDQVDVVTESGLVPTIAKQARLYLESIPDAAADLSSQMADGRIHASEAVGRPLVANGQFFYALNTDPRISRTLWQRVNATTSLHIVDDVSAEGFAAVASSAAGAQAFVQVSDDDATDRAFAYYIDPVLGSDGNTGTSKMQAFASLSPVAALLTAGMRIAIVRGAVLYSELVSAVDRITVSAYGTGAAPIIDASDLIAPGSWSKTSGQTNVYEVPINLPGDVKISGNVYADGVALKLVTSIALCNSTPGSAYVVSWSAVSTKLYLNPPGSTDPRVDGHEYRYSRRASSIFLSGSDCTVRGIVGRRNGHQDGSIRLTGNRALIQHAEAADGSRHSMIVGAGCLLENLEFVGGRNDLEITANTLVVNQPSVVGAKYRTRRCTFDAGGDPNVTGVQNHGANANDLFAQVVHEDPTFIGLSQAVDVAAQDTQVLRPIFENTLLGIFFGRLNGVCLMQGATGTLQRIYSAEAVCTYISKNNVLTVPLLVNGCYKSEVAGDVTTQISGDKVTVLAGTPPSANFIRHLRGALSINGSDFGPALAFPANSFLNAGYSGGTATYSGDYNSFPFGASFTFNGTTYNTLAEWQAATGQDVHSVTKQPVASFSDSFDRADENLEANASWTRIGGVAAMAGVRSNQLAILGSTQSLYAAPALGSADHYVRFTVASVAATANSFVVLRAADQNNWIGIRWNTTQWQVYRCVAGVLSQISTSSVIAPAVGQDVVFAVRGTYFCYYVNGRALGVLQAIGSTVLNDNVRAGLVGRGAAQNPLIDNFSCGLA